MTEKTALHFGAGNIGRGFIGALLSKSGYHVVFADVVEPLITALNKHGEYTITILDVAPAEPTVKITGVSGVLSNKPDELLAAMQKSSLVTTAVGPNVLKIIARSLAAGITARRLAATDDSSRYLNVIACENMTRASSHLRDEVLKHLTSDEDREFLDTYVGFPNCAVDRIVPPFTPGSDGNVLSVGVEAFYEWIVEQPAFKGPRPDITGMGLTDNLVAYVQRKLFTLNCGHATTAYLGFLKGYKTVDEALKDSAIEETVRGAMTESGAAICREHGFDPAAHAEYIDRIMNRFRNPYIKDDVARVGREPLRKLSPADRLVGPARLADKYGLPKTNLLKAIAACLRYNNPADPQSVTLQADLASKGAPAVVADVLGYPQDSSESKEVLEAYNALGA